MTAIFKTTDGRHTVHATQITRETFDGPQPSAACLIGVVYDPTHQTAMVPTQQGDTITKIGDWIVQGETCELAVLSAREFAASYELLSCERCGDKNWVCEQHHELGWPHDDCAGPGDPCPDCNPLAGTVAEPANPELRTNRAV